MNSRRFERYIGIDYSGAMTAESRCKGLRAYLAELDSEPQEITDKEREAASVEGWILGLR